MLSIVLRDLQLTATTWQNFDNQGVGIYLRILNSIDYFDLIYFMLIF